MSGSYQRQVLLTILENLPGIAFLVLSQLNADLRLAGWIGTLLAVVVCALYVGRWLRPNPILLGINLFMVATTPMIEALYMSGLGHIAEMIIANLNTAVLICVFLTGCVLTCMSGTGFFGLPAESRKQTLYYSAILLFVSAAGGLWSIWAGESRLLTLVAPLSVLFGVRQYLSAGIMDRGGAPHAMLATAATAPVEPSA